MLFFFIVDIRCIILSFGLGVFSLAILYNIMTSEIVVRSMSTALQVSRHRSVHQIADFCLYLFLFLQQVSLIGKENISG